MTVLTDEQQAFVGAVGISSMPTPRARLAGVMGVYLDGHRPMQEGFIGDHAVQFGKGPFGRGSVGLSLLLARLFAMRAPRALADVCQVLQSDQRMGISRDDAFGDHMIGVTHISSFHAVFAKVLHVLLQKGEYSLEQPIQLALS